MNKHNLGSKGESQECEVHREDEGKIQYLLGAEEQLLRLISMRVPLRKVLDEICNALDCQIGNVVSSISLPEDDPAELIFNLANAAFFGLHAFCSAGVVAGNGEPLGSLEMYSCDSRNPTASEFQCIERARCLASIAIKRHKDAAQHSSCDLQVSSPAQGRALASPDTVH
jgi:hypothetical protein